MGKLGDTLDSAVGLLEMLKKPPGSDPRYRGVAPNRTDFTFMRYNPAKLPERLQKSLAALRNPDNPMRKDMLETIEAGLEVGEDWYNTEELRDWFIMGHGPEEGNRQWAEYIDLVGATSPGSKVPANIGNASAVRNRLYTDPEYLPQLQNVQKLDQGRALAKNRQPGYGHKTAGLQELVVARQQQGLFDASAEPGVAATKSSMVVNPKPKGFGQSLKGSEKNIAADLHFTRYFAMASMDPDWLATGGTEGGQEVAEKIIAAYPKAKKYFTTNKMGDPSFNPKAAVNDGVVPIEAISDNPGVWAQMPRDAEYGAMEDFMFELGNELGLTGPQVQAALWMGAARKTGVDPTSQTTFMGAIRDRADIQAANRGQTREQVLFDFIMNKGLLTGATAAPLGVLGLSQPNQAQAAPMQNELMQYLEANR